MCYYVTDGLTIKNTCDELLVIFGACSKTEEEGAENRNLLGVICNLLNSLKGELLERRMNKGAYGETPWQWSKVCDIHLLDKNDKIVLINPVPKWKNQGLFDKIQAEMTRAMNLANKFIAVGG